MGEKIPIVSERKFAYKGLFNMKESYEYIKHFLEDTKQYEEDIKDYEEKNDGGERVLRAIVEWKQLYSDVFHKYIKYQITLSGKETVAEVNGKAVTLCKGSVQLEINAYLEVDPLGKKDSSTINDFINKIYAKFFRQTDFAKCAGSLGEDVNEVVKRLKANLNSVTK